MYTEVGEGPTTAAKLAGGTLGDIKEIALDEQPLLAKGFAILTWMGYNHRWLPRDYAGYPIAREGDGSESPVSASVTRHRKPIKS